MRARSRIAATLVATGLTQAPAVSTASCEVMERWQAVFDVQAIRASGSVVLVPAPDVVVADGAEAEAAAEAQHADAASEAD